MTYAMGRGGASFPIHDSCLGEKEGPGGLDPDCLSNSDRHLRMVRLGLMKKTAEDLPVDIENFKKLSAVLGRAVRSPKT